MADNIIDFQRQQAVDAFLSEWQLQILHISGSLDLMEQHFHWTEQQAIKEGGRPPDSSDAKFYKVEIPAALVEARAALDILKKLADQS